MGRTRLFLLSLGATAAALVALWAASLFGGSSPAQTDAGTDPDSSTAEATAVLVAWDRQRAQAWAQGDPTALQALYAGSSTAGKVDVRHLRRWTARGLRVEGADMELISLTVLDHDPERWELSVTDRLGPAVAVGEHTRVLLPRDEATQRRIVLVLDDGAWKVASVD